MNENADIVNLKQMFMKTANTGKVGFVIGLVVYVLVSVLTISGLIGSIAIVLDQYTNDGDRVVFAIVAPSFLFLFIAVSLWFISFSTAYRQRKTQIELLTEILSK